MDTLTHSHVRLGYPRFFLSLTDYGELLHLRLGRVDLPVYEFGIKAGLFTP